MTGENDLSSFWCWNEGCEDYGKRLQGNIRVHDRLGKKKTRLLKCKTCGKTFSERKGTIFWGLHTSPHEILRTLALLPEKGSIRGLARATGYDKSTIVHWVKLAGDHAKEVNAYFLRNLMLTQVQVDEIWSYIKKAKSFHKK